MQPGMTIAMGYCSNGQHNRECDSRGHAMLTRVGKHYCPGFLHPESKTRVPEHAQYNKVRVPDGAITKASGSA